MSDKEYPSLAQQGKNLAGFTWELVNYITNNHQKVLFASDDLYKERMTICRGCDKYDELENRCIECGCYLATKARIIIDSCPLKKWEADSSDWEERFSEIQNDMGLDNTSESQ